jgi:hypothetical protein
MTFDPNSSFFIDWYRGSSRSAHCASHPLMASRDLHPMPLEHLLLPVQRLVIGEFGGNHLRQ